MASTIKVNNIQNQCGANIINESANTITIGASGDTISLAAGASQTGFGRTGTVDWDTTAKTTNFTAVSGNGYFVNTTSGAITVTLPASPSAGDIISIFDYARTFATNNVTVGRNGSLIQGIASDGTISTNGQSTTFIYVDGTKGWVPTEDQTTNNYGFNPVYITATGGTETTCGNYKIHTFTGPGTFTVSCAGNACGSNTVSYVVVGGGGAGGSGSVGGGGAGGGYREGKASSDCYTASPLNAPAGLPVSATAYPITVGAGGNSGSSGPEDSNTAGGNPGSNSIFSTITSAGGGRGASSSPGVPNASAGPGGSGGGGGNPSTGGTGNTPPVSPPQGSDGLTGGSIGGGGGGASATPNGQTWIGISGVVSNINASPINRAGGGGGGKNSCTPVPAGQGPLGGGAGGSGGGGSGATGPSQGEAGATNLGGGGGGGGRQNSVTSKAGGNGGSGIVIIRYKYQ